MKEFCCFCGSFVPNAEAVRDQIVADVRQRVEVLIKEARDRGLPVAEINVDDIKIAMHCNKQCCSSRWDTSIGAHLVAKLGRRDQTGFYTRVKGN